MAERVTVPRIIWEPTDVAIERANLTRFLRWLRENRDVTVAGYPELWRWSVTELEDFWDAIWHFYGLSSPTPYEAPLVSREMPGATWFPGAHLNYAEHVLSRACRAESSVIYLDEGQPSPRTLNAEALRGQVGACAAALRSVGVQPGDRVVGYLPNIPETVVAMLATTAVGAVWSVCGPDFGAQSVADRFSQLEPKVLFSVDGYRFGGRTHDRRATLKDLQAALPSLVETVTVGPMFPADPTTVGFDQFVGPPQDPSFVSVPFDHPLWVLFSSGTTGIPKGLVHSHGGILIEHLKSLGLSLDLGPTDRFFFHTSTSWMAWNYLIGGLLHGATPILYNGSPTHPSQDVLWSIAARTGATVVGVGSAYVSGCQKAGLELDSGLRTLRTVIPTGSPLAPSGWQWLEQQLPTGTRIDSICGGTDVCTAFFVGNPLLPVYSGEISARALGVKAECWNSSGEPLQDALGEFVVTEPMPSMPVELWNDRDGRRYHDSYFDVFPGVWRQGDWITISVRGTVTVSGRSDAMLNRQGVRIGSAEIYAAVEQLPEVTDSLVVGVESVDGGYEMTLFVVMAPGAKLNDALRATIKTRIKTRVSPRHLPDKVVESPAVPRTLTGKKLEVPVKRVLQGHRVEESVALGAIDDVAALQWYAHYGARSAMESRP
jgi:acetoacetyl-CoA synthetase